MKKIEIKKHLMTAISFFLPIVVGAGFLLAIGNMMGGQNIQAYKDGFTFADTLVTMGINKINISSDIKIVFANKRKEVLANGGSEIREPNVMFPPCMEETKKVAIEKIKLFKSDKKAKLYY